LSALSQFLKLNLSGNQRNGAEFSALAGATVEILDISGNGMAKLDLAEVKDRGLNCPVFLI